MRLAETMIRAGAQLEAFLIAVAYAGVGREKRQNPELHEDRGDSACPTRQPDVALVRRLVESLSPASDHPAFRARGPGENKRGRWRCK